MDNTLGTSYPNAGRIYVTYVDRVENDDNPADNTDIFLKSSNDGGATWSARSGSTTTSAAPTATPKARPRPPVDPSSSPR